MKAVELSLSESASGLCWLPLLALVWSTAAPAAVEFQPAVSVGVAHTDNLTLDAEDPERETVYRLTPAFTFAQDGTRVSSDVNYRAEGYYYDNRGDSEAYHIFDGGLQAALDPDNFFLELGAARDQTVRDPEAPIPRSNLPISGNRVNRDDYYAGPRLQYPIGRNATIAGSYRRSWTRYDDDQPTGFFVSDFDTDTFAFSVDNYRRERGFTWATRYSSEKTDYGVFVPWEFRRAAVEIGAWVASGLRLFASGGKESPWDDPFDPSLEDGFWEAGIARQAGERLTVELAAGERTFGSSQRASLDVAFRRGRMGLRYTEQPTTQGRDAFRDLPFPDLPPYGLDDFLNRPGAAERFISKRLNFNVSFDLRRTGVSLTVFDESRDERARIDGTPLEEEAQSGGYLTATWRAGARTSLVFAAENVRREFGGGNEQDLRSASIGADYRLGGHTELALRLMRTREDSEREDLGFDYTADLVSLLLTRTF